VDLRDHLVQVLRQPVDLVVPLAGDTVNWILIAHAPFAFILGVGYTLRLLHAYPGTYASLATTNVDTENLFSTPPQAVHRASPETRDKLRPVCRSRHGNQRGELPRGLQEELSCIGNESGLRVLVYRRGARQQRSWIRECIANGAVRDVVVCTGGVTNVTCSAAIRAKMSRERSFTCQCPRAVYECFGRGSFVHGL